MSLLRKFLNWMYDDPEATYASSRAKAGIFFVFAGIVVLILVFGLIWLDNYIRHNT